MCIFNWLNGFAVGKLITSKMSKYYEQVKSNYTRDVDHLINFKRDGLWIKKN